MDWLFIPSASEETEMKDLSLRVSAFAKETPALQDSIKDFPAEEGFAPTAKEDAVFTIVTAFLAWLKDQPDPQGTSYDSGNISPTMDAHRVQRPE